MPTTAEKSVSQEAVGTCGLCLNERTLIRAHIFPQWMGRQISGGGKLIGLSADPKIRPQNILSNGANQRIFCRQCEDLFHAGDDYFYRFSAARDTTLATTYLSRKNPGKAIRIRKYFNCDKALIHRFFQTCVFRAHVSTLPAYKGINLGPYAEPLRAQLLQRYDGKPLHGFEVYLQLNTYAAAATFDHPVNAKIEGINVVRMTIPFFSAIVRVDQRSRPMFSSAIGGDNELWLAEEDKMHSSLTWLVAQARSIHGDKIERLIG